MKAGRELDALIAEKVMGLHSWVRRNEDDPGCSICGKGENTGHRSYPYYSTDIAAAWEVLDKFTTNYSKSSDPDGYGIKLEHRTENTGEMWLVTGVWTTSGPPYEDMDDEKFTVEAATAPLAICLAALKAVGHFASPLPQD